MAWKRYRPKAVPTLGMTEDRYGDYLKRDEVDDSWRELEAENRTLRAQVAKAKDEAIAALSELSEQRARCANLGRQLAERDAGVERLTAEVGQLLAKHFPLPNPADDLIEPLVTSAREVVDWLDDTCGRGYCVLDEGEGRDALERMTAALEALAKEPTDG